MVTFSLSLVLRPGSAEAVVSTERVPGVAYAEARLTRRTAEVPSLGLGRYGEIADATRDPAATGRRSACPTPEVGRFVSGVKFSAQWLLPKTAGCCPR